MTFFANMTLFTALYLSLLGCASHVDREYAKAGSYYASACALLLWMLVTGRLP